MAATMVAHNREMSTLLFLLGSSSTGPLPAPTNVRSLLKGASSLPMAVGNADLLGKVQAFGAYFRSTWVVGTGGSAPAGWAIAHRSVERHGRIRTTNMLAENGNRKMKQVPTLSPTSPANCLHPCSFYHLVYGTPCVAGEG